MLTSLLMSTGLPILLDLVKSSAGAVSRKFLGLSVEDQIKLDTAQVERLRALSELDNPHGEPDKWVVNLRGSFRYIVAILLIVGGLGLAAWGATSSMPEVTVQGLELAAAPFGFIFGERLVLSFKGTGR